MIKNVIGGAVLYNAPMEEVIRELDRVDHIFTDPPYLYIKTHDFDKPFDEALLFENAKRILPDSGFVALFGRGTSFYRWNTRLAELGFVFKEEIIWDKQYTTAPCIALSRVHETVSIHTKKTGKIRRVKVPYIEQKQHDIGSIINDIKRIKSAINTEAGLNNIIEFLNGGCLYKYEATDNFYNKGITTSDRLQDAPRELKTIRSLSGMSEKSIIKLTGGSGLVVQKKLKKERREFQTLRMINNDMREKSVLKLPGSHRDMSHPTEKPVRLAERIIALISDPGDTIYDPFMGSGSFGVACLNAGRKYIGSEISAEYYKTATDRMRQCVSDLGLFADAV
jgi:site-specific DNA-methyltransferase (adenine-specific)